MADALGVLPKSPWHLHPHFHTHHLLPTTSICDIPALGFLWPQKHAWPIWGTVYNLGALYSINKREIGSRILMPQLCCPNKGKHLWSMLSAACQVFPAAATPLTHGILLSFFSIHSHVPINCSHQALSWDLFLQ